MMRALLIVALLTPNTVMADEARDRRIHEIERLARTGRAIGGISALGGILLLIDSQRVNPQIVDFADRLSKINADLERVAKMDVPTRDEAIEFLELQKRRLIQDVRSLGLDHRVPDSPELRAQVRRRLAAQHRRAALRRVAGKGMLIGGAVFFVGSVLVLANASTVHDLIFTPVEQAQLDVDVDTVVESALLHLAEQRALLTP